MESRDLTAEQWEQKTTGLDELGRRILDEYGLHVQFHSHADSHVGYQPEIERLLESTNPEWVNLCFDTGHIAYYGGDCLELIKKYPERIGYLHLKQINPEIVEQGLDRDLSFPEAVRMGAMIEPPLGVPGHAAAARGAWPHWAGISTGIIEHDLYPVPARPAAADRQADQDLSQLLQRSHHRLREVVSDRRTCGSPCSGVGMMGAFHVDALSKRDPWRDGHRDQRLLRRQGRGGRRVGRRPGGRPTRSRRSTTPRSTRC